jgi:hypothetical protein
MLRCYRCRGYAMAGLAHLHGLDVPLCKSCTDEELERQKVLRASEALKARLARRPVKTVMRGQEAA